jgi:hypothetical protein
MNANNWTGTVPTAGGLALFRLWDAHPGAKSTAKPRAAPARRSAESTDWSSTTGVSPW